MAAPNNNFNLAINRVLKQVHPDSGMSGDALDTVNNLVNIVIEKLMNEVNNLMHSSTRKTVSSREIQSAVRLVFGNGELLKHAVSEGTKAVTKYNAVTTTGGSKSAKEKSTGPVPRSAKAGIIFPVTRVETLMMSLTSSERKSDGAAVYLAAVVEYVVAEILELAGNTARDDKRTRIIPRSILLAIENDIELKRLFSDTVLSGGVVPFSVPAPEKKAVRQKSKKSTKSKKTSTKTKPSETSKKVVRKSGSGKKGKKNK